MTEKLIEEIAQRLEAALSAGITDDGIKRLKKSVSDIIYDIESDIDYRIKDAIAPELVHFVEDMAAKTIDAILKGQQDQMLRYLGCEQGRWTGRSDSPAFGVKRLEEWHPVIHGKLFEQGAVALRAQIAEAHRDLIASERIKDLEDQVKCLVAQVNKANHEKEKMWERLRESERL